MATLSTAQSLVKAADRTAERTAQSMGDRVQSPTATITPTIDPKSFVQQSQDISRSTFEQAGLPAAFERSRMSGKQAQDSLDFIAEKYVQEEKAKIPLEDMQAERDRLMSAKFRILPDMLARTDLLDYKAKVNLANQLIGTYDSEINSIDEKRRSLETKAEERARLKVSEMESKAKILQQKSQDDRADLNSRLELYQIGQGNLQDILEAAVGLEETNAKLAAESKANPFIGAPGEASIGGFNPKEISLFLQYEKFGDWNIPDSVKTQYATQLMLRYAEWERAGRPVAPIPQGSGFQWAGAATQGGYYKPGSPTVSPKSFISANDEGFVNPFTRAAEARKVLSPTEQLYQGLSKQLQSQSAVPESM